MLRQGRGARGRGAGLQWTPRPAQFQLRTAPRRRLLPNADGHRPNTGAVACDMAMRSTPSPRAHETPPRASTEDLHCTTQSEAREEWCRASATTRTMGLGERRTPSDCAPPALLRARVGNEIRTGPCCGLNKRARQPTMEMRMWFNWSLAVVTTGAVAITWRYFGHASGPAHGTCTPQPGRSTSAGSLWCPRPRPVARRSGLSVDHGAGGPAGQPAPGSSQERGHSTSFGMGTGAGGLAPGVRANGKPPCSVGARAGG